MTKWSSMFWPPVKNVYSDKRMDKKHEDSFNCNKLKSWKKLKKYLSELTRIIDDTKERNLFSVSGTQFLRHKFFFVSSLMWENYLRELTFKRKKKKKSVSSSRLKKNYFASKPRVQKSKPQFFFLIKLFILQFSVFLVQSS